MSRGMTYKIPRSKHDQDEVCQLRHEIGRAGKACCNCEYCDECKHREDKDGTIASVRIRTDKEE